ncbi:MAG TPA: DUF362 domain-containing protein [Candidatus Sulfotelmatobacter sp.]|jgi:uncharacterized protein (DUF362 family)|nr:DUF362 domain-containing protein [Candidatus Sulfotelmatobacter sp.]
MDRRTFVKAGCIGSASLLMQGLDPMVRADVAPTVVPPIELRSLPNYKPSHLGMPGLFPGRVIELHDPNAIVRNRVSQPIVHRLLDQGMKELTGENSAGEAWRKFVEPKDIVGIKINPSGAPACCSSPEIVREIISAVQSVGVPPQNIVVYDRYAYEMDIGSYQALLPPGVRIVGIQEAFAAGGEYELNVYCDANLFGEWETRSYMANVVTHEVTKIINVPTMKDHSAAGVTGALKNLAYGTFNNVARTHRAPYSFTNPLIGLMCTVEPLRSKSVLHIMDGLRLVWHGGPLTQVQDFIDQAGILMVATDPVAMDTIELEAIEKKRSERGVPSLWQHDPNSITSSNNDFFHDATKNLYFRQPGHIAAAGKLGLGVADLKQIDHRRLSA